MGSTTAPLSVRRSATAMPLRRAAAAFSVSRAMAPAWRSLTKLSGTVVDPPVACIPISFMAISAPPRAVRASRLSSLDRNGTASSPNAVFQ